MREKRSFIVGCCLAASLLVCTYPVSAQTTTVTVKVEHESNRIIKGKVTDLEGHSLPGVNVVVKGFQGGTVCDIDGNFKISAPREDVILKFSYIGMEPQEITVKAGQKKEIQVRMKEDTNEINEVVVTGFANIRKESFTGNTITVKRDELLKVNKTNVLSALQAFDPSFRIAENNTWGSDPNALPEVYLRGKSGFGVKELDVTSKSALKNNPNLPTFIMDGFEISVTKLYDFDPSRIENVTILRDAAATAMYGSRAANGVIIITTVAPKPGKLNVAYSLTGEIETPDLSDYNLLNASEKLEVERLAGCYDINSPNAQGFSSMKLYKEYVNKLYNIRNGVDTYWLSKPLRTAFNARHSLYVDGGSEKVRFGVELNVSPNSGVMKGSFRDVWTTGTYIDYRIGNLQVRNHTTYTVNRSKESPYGSFADYTKQMPYDIYQNADGSYLKSLQSWHGEHASDRYNPLYEATLLSFDRSSYEELINNLSVQWNFLNDFLLKSTFGITRQFNSNEKFNDPHSQKNTYPLSETNLSSGELTTGSGDNLSLDWQASLAYNRFIKEHNINVSLGINIKEDRSKTLSAFYRGFPSGSLYSPNYAQEIVNKPAQSEEHSRLVGFTGLVNYSFQDIYLLDASIRFDGSSKFGTDNKFDPFWSAGGGLNIHNYKFMKDWGFFDQLKARVSYGQVGKIGFSSYASRTTYEILSDEWYKTGYGAVLSALGNTNLTWETTNTFDAGLEMRLLKNKLYVRASYYLKRTVDLINDVTIPSHSGFTTYVDNVGEVENKGFELDVRGDIIRTKDWSVAVFGNMAHNKNTILKISDSQKAYNAKVDAFLNDLNQRQARYGTGSKSYKKYIEGGSESSIWAMKSLGIDPATGDELFITPDGKVTNIWNSADQVVVGNSQPDFNGTFGFNVQWKNFSVYTTFMYEWGGQRYNQTLADKVENVDIYKYNADKRVLTDRWKQPGDIAMFKRLEAGNRILTTQSTSRFVQDYNCLSLNSITLGYDFEHKLIAPMHLSMLRFEIGANDLFRLSSVKQERGLSYPYSHSFNFSLKASF